MNKFFIISVSISVATTLFAGSLSHDEIKKMVEDIKKERVGIKLIKLNNTSNPFIILKKPKKAKATVKTEEITYTLTAIFNSAAFINGKWYKKGDKLGKYTVGYVSSSSVKIKSALGNKVLSLAKKKKSFIKLNQGIK